METPRPRTGRLIVEGHTLFEGELPVGTWSRDILLDEEEGARLQNRDALQIDLEVQTFRAGNDTDGDQEERGVGLIALAVV